jgi:NADP-dependent 3-hydroxy acid dehydrogenase YdfG
MVFLAGVYWPIGAKDWNADQIEMMADVNFTGAVRVLGQCLPAMVARDSGHIVITGSLSGFRGLPGAIGYAPSKAGVMALAESLQADLWRTGVRVQLANPGFIRTRLTDKNDFKMPFLMEPEQAAQEIFELMCDEGAFVRHFPRVFSWVFRLSRFLPGWIYYRLFA